MIEQTSDVDLPPDYNVAPTKRVYIVAQRPPSGEAAAPLRTLAVARWGLVPSWAKDPAIGNKLINARVETAASKPSFRKAYAARRCLIPAAGFYEWYTPLEPGAPTGRAGKPRKQPFFIHPPDGGSLALAGLYEFWRDPDPEAAGPWLMSVTILTTTASDALGRIHDRMPLPLPRHLWPAWLDPSTDAERVAGVLEQHTAAELDAHPVSTLVNSVRNNGPELMDPVAESA